MPKSPRPALSHNNFPPGEPPAPRITYRLLFIVSWQQQGIQLVLGERGKAENGHPRVKLPQIKLPGYLSGLPHRLNDDDVQLVRQESLRFLANLPYNIPAEYMEVEVWTRIEPLKLPPWVVANMQVDEMHYIPVHAKLIYKPDHLDHLPLQRLMPIPELFSLLQSYRVELVKKCFGFFNLHTGNVLTLPRKG